MIAICGLVCTDCPAFTATQKDSDEERKKVAESWSTEKEILKPEDINCDGCIAVGKRLFPFCNVCDVRLCALERNAKNCAYCDEYLCGKLKGLFEHMQSQEAKANLDEIRKGFRV